MSQVRFRYQTIEFGSTDIHLRTLRDRQQFSDNDGLAASLGISSAVWPLFGVIWPSSVVLAQYVNGIDVQNKRVLEVGCGIGLVSLLLNHRQADITATDYHPEAGQYLRENVKLNKGRPIPFVRTNWNESNDELGGFDLVLGSDLLYEKEHVGQLSGFIDRHAKEHSEIIIVDPGRGHRAAFSKKMGNLGYEIEYIDPSGLGVPGSVFKGKILRFHR